MHAQSNIPDKEQKGILFTGYLDLRPIHFLPFSFKIFSIETWFLLIGSFFCPFPDNHNILSTPKIFV